MLDLKKISQQLYTISFIMGYSYLFLKQTTINLVTNLNILYVPLVVGITIILCMKFLFDGISLYKIITKSLLSLLIIIVSYNSKSPLLIITGLLVIFADNIDFKKNLKISLFIGIFLTIVAFILAKINLIPDLIYYRADGAIRDSFGFMYVTIFSGVVFYLVTIFVYLNWNKKVINLLLICSFIYVFINYCDARLGAVALIGLLIINLFDKLWLIILKNRIVKFGIIYASYFIMFSISYFSAKFYPQLGIWGGIANDLLSDRLSLGYRALLDYSPNWFGQLIIQYGNGASVTRDVTKQYFYIDSGFLQSLLLYGIVFSVILAISYIMFFNKMYFTKNYHLIMIFLLILATNLVDPLMLGLGTNVFLIAFLADTKSSMVSPHKKQKWSIKIR